MITQTNRWKHRWVLLAIGLCLLISIATLTRFQHSEAQQETAADREPATVSPVAEIPPKYIPLAKLPSEPAAFLESVQKLGEKLIAEAEEILKKENLSLEEQASAVETMHWGLRFKYGDDWDIFAEKLFAFYDGLTEKQFRQPVTLGSLFNWNNILHQIAMRLEIEETIQQEDFEKICDTSVLIRDKYLRIIDDENFAPFIASSLDFSTISRIADTLDPDTTRGFVQLAAKKLGIDPDKPNNPKGTLEDRGFGTIRRTRLLGTELEMQGVDKDGKTVDIKQFRGKPVLIICPQEISETNRNITSKLYELLQPEGLVMLKLQPDTAGMMMGIGEIPKSDRPIKPEEVAEFPGMIVKSNFYDYYRCGAHQFVTSPLFFPAKRFVSF